MRIKLTDVAQKAGVSVTTVSRVINHHGYLSDKTKQKVLAAMQALNYQPNSVARSLQGKQLKLIGLIFPNLTNPFFAELIEQIEGDFFKEGYKVILCNAGYNRQKERTYLRMLMANQVDGIIAGAHNIGITEYQRLGLPIVSFDRKLAKDVPIVSCNNYEGIKLSVTYLRQKGCHHLTFVGNKQQKGNPTDQRLQAYLETTKKLGLTQSLCSVAFSDPVQVKEMVLNQLLTDKKPDGLICTDDLTALLALKEAQKIGLKVPDQLKVIGFDGTKFIQTYHPSLSTIAQPIGAIAALLVKLLLIRINHPKRRFHPLHYQLPVKLIKSQTTAS